MVDQEGIFYLISDYFTSIFASSHPSEDDFLLVLEDVNCRIDNFMNQVLTKSFTEEEILLTLKQTYLHKVPGSDGLSNAFFRNYWEIVGPDIIHC